MKWVALCLRNKLLISLAVIALCLAGLFSLYTSSITLFPPISFNDLNINIDYPGANAQTVQQQVTAEISRRLQSLDHLTFSDASSEAGHAHIHLTLQISDPYQMLQTQMKVLQAINGANLPSGVSQPQVDVSSGQSSLISFMGFSDSLSQFQMGNFLQANLSPKLSSLPGVSIYDNFLDSVVRIKINPEAIAKYKLSVTDVNQTIAQNYESSPLGNLVVNKKNYVLNIGNDYTSLNALRHLLIGYRTAEKTGQAHQLGMPIYLQDIAQIKFEPRNIVPQSYFSYNGHLGVNLGLNTFTQANPLVTAQLAKNYVAALQRHLPADMKLVKYFDSSTTMKASINEVSLTIAFASLLVLLVALCFLGHFRTTLVPIVTIPICLLGAMLCINLLGYSLTVISLLAMVIAVGLVVDDAIVVVENITRHVELGLGRKQAVLQGTAEIMKTIIGITLTLLAVYLPIIFVSGPLGALLKPFAVTLASAVLISGVISLTLTPIMANSLILTSTQNRYQVWFNRLLHLVINGYQYFLTLLLQAPKLTLLLIALLLAIGGFFTVKLPKLILPPDPSTLVNITMTAVTGDDVNSLKKKISSFDPFFDKTTVSSYTITINKDPQINLLQAIATIHYKDKYLKQNLQFTNDINAYIKKHDIQNASAKMENFSNWGGPYDINFFMYGSDANQTDQQTNQVIHYLKASKKFSVVTSDMAKPEQQLAFNIDQLKAARLGIYRPQIQAVLAAYYGGSTLNHFFNIAGLSVPVLIQLDKQDLQNPQSIEKLTIISPQNGKSYPLSDFVHIQLISKPASVRTFNNAPAVSVFANLASGVSMGQGIDAVNQIMQHDVPNAQFQYVDNAARYLQSNHQSLFIAVLGTVCIYFLLTILFRNLLDPFIIMLTVPFTVIGGALSLYLIDGSFNLFSVLGLITLVGLITKHGILIIQFANAELKKGALVLDAILSATRHRFRPVIMTTLAMVLGALPLLLSSEMMYVSRQNLAIVLIGGLLIGTLFSLFIVPIVYVLMKRVEQIRG
jgi:hydrophobe/amphiphile efflux-1 (HAE1) family protein